MQLYLTTSNPWQLLKAQIIVMFMNLNNLMLEFLNLCLHRTDFLFINIIYIFRSLNFPMANHIIAYLRIFIELLVFNNIMF